MSDFWVFVFVLGGAVVIFVTPALVGLLLETRRKRATQLTSVMQDPPHERLRKTLERHRGQNLHWAVAIDDCHTVLAKGDDLDKVSCAARKTGRKFFLVGTPPV